ncbi:MAG: diguanylate cyclase [Panacagrimonas sp.]
MSGDGVEVCTRPVSPGRRFNDQARADFGDRPAPVPPTPDPLRARSSDDLEAAVRDELELTRTLKRPLSLLSIGVDRARGLTRSAWDARHPALIEFADACARQLRATDVMGRVDDELYIALLPGTHAVGAQCAAERLRTAVAALRLAADSATTRRLTASIGIATTRTGVTSYQALRSRADARRDDARHLGGNRVMV